MNASFSAKRAHALHMMVDRVHWDRAATRASNSAGREVCVLRHGVGTLIIEKR